MERITISPRSDFVARLHSLGRSDYRRPNFPYFGWNEAAYYTFTDAEVAVLSSAAINLERMIREGVEHAISSDGLRLLGFENEVAELITSSWKQSEPALISRFDFGFDGSSAPKLFEYHADVPHFLLEASRAQRQWIEEVRPGARQCNTFEELLVFELNTGAYPKQCHLVAFSDAESVDLMNYLSHCLDSGGVAVTSISVETVHPARGELFDGQGTRISSMFKCFGWEEVIVPRGMHRHLIEGNVRVMEPAWKMLASSKRFLAVLSDLFPDHPNLVPTTVVSGNSLTEVRKSALCSGGHGIEITRNDSLVAKVAGTEMFAPFIYQSFVPLQRRDGYIPTVSVWTVGGKVCCLGVREDSSPITNIVTSNFVPHCVE